MTPGSQYHYLEESCLTSKNTRFEIYLSKRETLTSWGTIYLGVFYYSSKNYANITLNTFLGICWVSPSPWGLWSYAALSSCPLGLRAPPCPQLGVWSLNISHLHALPPPGLPRTPAFGFPHHWTEPFWQMWYLSTCLLSFQLLSSITLPITWPPSLICVPSFPWCI